MCPFALPFGISPASVQADKNKSWGAGEMAPLLRAHIFLTKDSNSLPSTHIRQRTSARTPAPGANTDTHTYTQINNEARVLVGT